MKEIQEKCIVGKYCSILKNPITNTSKFFLYSFRSLNSAVINCLDLVVNKLKLTKVVRKRAVFHALFKLFELFFKSSGQNEKSLCLNKPDGFLFDYMKFGVSVIYAVGVLFRSKVTAKNNAHFICIAALYNGRTY